MLGFIVTIWIAIIYSFTRISNEEETKKVTKELMVSWDVRNIVVLIVLGMYYILVYVTLQRLDTDISVHAEYLLIGAAVLWCIQAIGSFALYGRKFQRFHRLYLIRNLIFWLITSIIFIMCSVINLI